MIHLEDAYPLPHCAAPGIGIEAGSQDHELTHTALDGGGQSILGEARPNRDEDSHPSSGWVRFGFPGYGLAVLTEDTQSERIGEVTAIFQQLMSGAVTGRRQFGPARFSELHTLRVYRGAPGSTTVPSRPGPSPGRLRRRRFSG